jgi:hypothetical protein
MVKKLLLCLICFLTFHASCQAVWYKDLKEELQKKIQPQLNDKLVQEKYDAGVRLRKGNKLFQDSEVCYTVNSLSSVIAAKICFESALKKNPLKDELYYKLLHNQAMISLRLFELDESLRLFKEAAPHIINSKNSLEIIEKIKKEFQLDSYIDSYKEEMIYLKLFSGKKVDAVKVTNEEADFFKFSDPELEGLFFLAQKIQELTATSKKAVVLSVGRSPFWVTQALRQLPSVHVIPLSFSLARKKGEAELLPGNDRQCIDYMNYLKNKLREVSPTHEVYVLDFVGTGQSASDFCDLCQGSFFDKDKKVSILEGRTHLIELKNPALRDLEIKSLLQHYTSVHPIELPPSLRFLLSNKSPYYKFLFLPPIGFYPHDWEKQEPDTSVTFETAVPSLRLEQIKSWPNVNRKTSGLMPILKPSFEH